MQALAAEVTTKVPTGGSLNVLRSLYFIAAPRAQVVKIGVARNVQQRFHGLQTGSAEELLLLGTIATDRADEMERGLHEALRRWRVRGEWFRLDDDMRAFIWEVRDTLPEEASKKPSSLTAFDLPRGNSRADKLARYKLSRGLVA